MGLWLRGWLGVGTAVALLGGLLWLLAEGNVGSPALLRSAAWGLVVWVGSGLIWIGLEYGQGQEDVRKQWVRAPLVSRELVGADRRWASSKGRTQRLASDRRRGSSSSRRASPTRLTATTVSMMQKPGTEEIHHARRR
jgi:hypothetical protein